MTQYQETQVTRKIAGLGITVTALVESDTSGDTAEQPADAPEVTEITDIVIDDLGQFVDWLESKMDLDGSILEEFNDR